MTGAGQLHNYIIIKRIPYASFILNTSIEHQADGTRSRILVLLQELARSVVLIGV
jgi:hypothetical protein